MLVDYEATIFFYPHLLQLHIAQKYTFFTPQILFNLVLGSICFLCSRIWQCMTMTLNLCKINFKQKIKPQGNISTELPFEWMYNSSGSVAFFGAFLFLMHLTFRLNCKVVFSFASSSPVSDHNILVKNLCTHSNNISYLSYKISDCLILLIRGH